uniref:NAD(P)-binding protein n=1 Tax=Phenylobacterium glaciei TaxID=2803784 RepID=A0A974S8R6_9CAUL|nr:NAD(P)-binding protein [Phenylobacterium glaciei]
MIADGRYSDAYMVNWRSNVFPGILGRTCDRPCEPACRRGRVEDEPVAICRLKRVAADNKSDITAFLPQIPMQQNGKTVALVGAGPAALTVARDLAPLGYHVVVFDGDAKAGGMIRRQIPASVCLRKSSTRRSATSPAWASTCAWASGSTASRRCWRTRPTTRSSSAPARRAAATSTCPAARRPRPISISASTGSPASPSSMSTASAGGSSSWAAATPPWTAAAPRAGSEARTSRSSSVPASTR